MRHFKGKVCTDVIGEFEFMVDDNATEQEIEELASSYAFDKIDYYYYERRK